MRYDRENAERVLNAIKEEYPYSITGERDYRFLQVKNPDFLEDDGSVPYLVLRIKFSE